MKILALDSSSPTASVALISLEGKNSSVLFREDSPLARSDSSAIFIAMEKALALCGTPDALCVGLGPGSYNGLRAGIAAARGFATARGIPLHSIPSPLALPGPDTGFWALGDARGGNYWIACVHRNAFLEEPTLLSPRDAAIHLRKKPDFAILSASPLDGIEGIRIATPCAVRLAMFAKTADPLYLTPEPLYLKPPNITTPRAQQPPTPPR